MFLPAISVCLIFSVFAADITEDKGVLVLDKSNFDRAIEENQHILVEFYAPWCGACKALEPDYDKAAKQLKEESSDIKLAKVDATVELELAEQFEVRAYPTIKFFRGGILVEYTGGREPEEIVTWLKNRTGPPCKTLKTTADSKRMIAEEEVVVIGFFKDTSSAAAKTFVKAATVIDDIPCGITSNPKVFTEHKVKQHGGIVLFKQFEEGRNDFGEITVESVKSFVSANSLPLVVEFTQERAYRIFGGGAITNFVLLCINKQNDTESDKKLENLKAVAADFKGEVTFVYFSNDEKTTMFGFLGLKPEQCPALRFVTLKTYKMLKYKPDTDDFSTKKVKEFVQSVLDGGAKEMKEEEEEEEESGEKGEKGEQEKQGEEVEEVEAEDEINKDEL